MFSVKSRSGGRSGPCLYTVPLIEVKFNASCCGVAIEELTDMRSALDLQTLSTANKTHYRDIRITLIQCSLLLVQLPNLRNSSSITFHCFLQ